MVYRIGLALAAGLAAGSVMANDFPTQARVEYVLSCMDRHGGQSYDTLYPCVCAVDKIAASMPYDEYAHAETMSFMIRTPGERGGAFRDAPNARKEVRTLKSMRKQAEDSCFISRAPGNAVRK